MTTLCSVGVSCTTVTGHDINFDAGKKKVKAIFRTAVVLVKEWAAHFLEERTISKKGCKLKI